MNQFLVLNCLSYLIFRHVCSFICLFWFIYLFILVQPAADSIERYEQLCIETF